MNDEHGSCWQCSQCFCTCQCAEGWKQIHMDTQNYDDSWAGPEPAIDGSEMELAVEAIAAKIHSDRLQPRRIMEQLEFDENWAGPEPADDEVTSQYNAAMLTAANPFPMPNKFLWLGRSFSQHTSRSGWRIFDAKYQALNSSSKDEGKITLFDDGTWSYGIHD